MGGNGGFRMCQSFESMGCMINKRREPVPEMQKNRLWGVWESFWGNGGMILGIQFRFLDGDDDFYGCPVSFFGGKCFVDAHGRFWDGGNGRLDVHGRFRDEEEVWINSHTHLQAPSPTLRCVFSPDSGGFWLQSVV